MLVYSVSLYFHLVLWVHIQDIIILWVGDLYRHLLMIHCPYRSDRNISSNWWNVSFKEGRFIQFKIQYQLRILKVPKTKRIKTLGDKTFARVGPSLWNTLPSSCQEYPECSGFQAGAKDLFVSFDICPMNQFVYSDCGVLFSFSLSVLFVMC